MGMMLALFLVAASANCPEKPVAELEAAVATAEAQFKSC